jgi:hypothetical protein
VKIQVTSEDIKRGLPSNFFGCALSLALSRATRKSVGIAWGVKEDYEKGHPTKGLQYLMYFKDGAWKFGNLPLSVLEWINDFDRKLEVAPMEFDFDV